MATGIQELTAEMKYVTLFVERVIQYEEDDEILFKPSPKKPILRKTPVINEIDAMSADLDDLRDGKVEPMVHLTAEQMAEIESERPGVEFCAEPFNY